MAEPAFLSRSMTADGRHVVAWSTGAISPSRLVANYRGAHKGPARYHDADAKAALQLIEIAGSVDLVDLIAAIPGTRERWRNRIAGGELPTAAQALAECDHCRSFRLTHADHAAKLNPYFV